MTRGNEEDPTSEDQDRPVDDGSKISRRTVLKGVAVVAGAALAEAGCEADEGQPWTGGTGGSGTGGSPQDAGTGGGAGGEAGAGGGDVDAEADAYTPPDMTNRVIVARNGTPPQNVAAALGLAGGIERFIDQDDVVVLKPNGQWRRQGYTHTECMKALIDEILARPGGFDGEIIIAEHIHRGVSESMDGQYCWNISEGDNRLNNWPDMSYLELVQDYHDNGSPNVTAAPLYDSGVSSDWVAVNGPGELAAGQSGWVRTTYTTTSTGGTVRLSHPIIRSAHSNRLIDLKDGVWDSGAYTGQSVKLIFLPTLNNHSSFDNEDYAGPTSAVKCHLGIVEFAGSGGVNLHDIGYGNGHPEAVGESVGELITAILSPIFYLTCAEYTGHRGRTAVEAEQTRTVGLCVDPVTLDYWMCKYVMYPIATSQTFMNPDEDNNLRKQLDGCHSKGVGTLVEAEMVIDQVG